MTSVLTDPATPGSDDPVPPRTGSASPLNLTADPSALHRVTRRPPYPVPDAEPDSDAPDPARVMQVAHPSAADRGGKPVDARVQQRSAARTQEAGEKVVGDFAEEFADEHAERMRAVIAAALGSTGVRTEVVADAGAAACTVMDDAVAASFAGAVELLHQEADRYVEGAFASGIREAAAILHRLAST